MKRILLILTIILSISITSQAQKTGSGDGGNSIARFYPNPAINNITFQFSNEQNYNLQIFSFLGRKMSETANVSNKTNINLSDFTRGVYIYQLYDRSGKMVETGKFQVSK